MTGSAYDLGDLVQRGYRFALSLTHDVGRAEDLIQDAWCAVLKAKGPMNRSYLFTTVRNRFIDIYRREKRLAFEPINEELSDVDVQDADQWSDDEYASSSNGSFETSLEGLRPEERAVLYLSAVEGYSAGDIAGLLEWPRGTVLSMLHRTRRKLRRQQDSNMRSTA